MALLVNDCDVVVMLGWSHLSCGGSVDDMHA